MTDYDVVVVGAGVAGLQAAREIRQKAPHLKVKVVEAKDRVGGRTLTVTLKTATGTDQWDLGGQWVGLTQPDLLNLMKELGVEMYPQYVDGTKLSHMGGSDIRPYSDTEISKAFKHFSLAEGWDFVKALRNIENKLQKLDFEDPFSDPEAVALDAQSLQTWCDANAGTRTMPDALDIASLAVFGTHANRLSLLFLMLYGKAADGSFMNTLEAAGQHAANSYKMQGGAQQLSRLMSEDLGNVELNTPVIRCENGEQAVTLTVLKGDKVEKITSNRVIFAIPPQQCASIDFQPCMPDHKHQLFTNMPMGNLIKFIITYKQPFWRNKNLSGEIISTGITDKPGDKRKPIMITFDATTHHENAALVGFINNEWAEGTTKTERRDAVLEDLERFFGSESRDFIDYEDIIWATVPYGGGCPVAIVPPGCTQWYTRIREPVGRLHFAGTETATNWPGYITGACQSGLRAAHEIFVHLASDKVDQCKLEGSVYSVDYKVPNEPEVNKPVQNGWFRLLKRVSLIGVLVGATYMLAKRRYKS